MMANHVMMDDDGGNLQPTAERPATAEVVVAAATAPMAPMETAERPNDQNNTAGEGEEKVKNKEAKMFGRIGAFPAALIAVLVAIFLSLHYLWTPYQRGFNCADRSIRHKFEYLLVSTRYLFLVTLAIPLVVIYVTERWRFQTGNCCHCLMKFLFGFTINLIVTEIFKRSFGRLRPHVFDFCHLDRYCPDGATDKYVPSFECQNDRYPWLVTNARLSFYSGHSALGAFTGAYLACYIRRRYFDHFRKLPRWRKAIGILTCVIIFFLYLIPGYTQWLIHWHFATDVLTGFTCGTCLALIIYHLVRPS